MIDFVPDQPTPVTSAAPMQPSGIDFVPDSQPSTQGAQSVQPAQSGGLWSDLSAMGQRGRNNGIGAAVLGLTHQGGNVIGDVGTGLVKAGFPNAGASLQNAGQQAVNVTPQQLGIQNPGVGTNLIAGAVQDSPMIAAAPEIGSSSWLSKIPAVGRLLTPGVQQAFTAGALTGATQSAPGTALSSALHQGADWAGLAAVPGIIGGIGGLYSKVSGVLNGQPVKDMANDIYQGLSGGQDATQLNANTMGYIRQNYNSAKNIVKQGYNSLFQNAEARGYGSPPVDDDAVTDAVNNPNSQTTNVKSLMQPLAGSKPIQISGGTQNQLMGILNPELSSQTLKGVSQPLKDVISQFNEAPTFSNAHTLQSMLGNESSAFKTGLTDIVDKQTANSLTSARNSVQNDIQNTFTQNGDQDLGSTYNQLSQNWKNQVLPYQQIPSIWKNINGRADDPDNVVNIIDGTGSRRQLIRNNLAQTPGASENIIAQKLAPASSNDVISGNSTDPNKFLNIYSNKIPSTFDQFKTPAIQQSVNSLGQKSASYEKYTPLLKKALHGIGTGAALSTGAVPIYELHKALF